MTLTIRQHEPGQDIRAFLDAAHEVFRGDPAWIPPLEFEMKDRLNPERNPFFRRGEATLFTAWEGDRVMGRCSAQIDREHLRIHKDETGFFGFFDTVDDNRVGQVLLEAAQGWLRERGMKRMRGPLSLYINDEVGTLVEGFEHPPVIMMAHSRVWQDRVAKACGLEKAKDLLAWRYDLGKVPERGQKAWDAIQAMPEIKIRTVNLSNLQQEMDNVMEIYNDAWRDLWGVVPALPDEVKKVVQDLKLILDPELAFMVELEGRPVAMCIALPNLNEAARDLGGKLFPFGWMKFLWRLKVSHPKVGRLMMLGIRQELRGMRRYAPLSLAMFVEIARRGTKRGYEWAELSWTLEDNRPINAGILAMGARVYKKYRVYEKAIG